MIEIGPNLKRDPQECTKCHKELPLDNFYFDNKYNRYRSDCKECNKAHGKKYRMLHPEHNSKRRKYPNGKERTDKNIYRKERGYGVIHGAVFRAIKEGVIKRPKYCQECGRSNQRIEAHHEDYSKPLEVVWLCVSCHKYLHRGIGEEAEKIRNKYKIPQEYPGYHLAWTEEVCTNAKIG